MKQTSITVLNVQEGETLADRQIASLVRWGVKFPSPDAINPVEGDDSQCHYCDSKETYFSFGPISSIIIEGNTSVDSEDVEHWTTHHRIQHADNLKFTVTELIKRGY
jgi:hypothetical protein